VTVPVNWYKKNKVSGAPAQPQIKAPPKNPFAGNAMLLPSFIAFAMKPTPPLPHTPTGGTLLRQEGDLF